MCICSFSFLSSTLSGDLINHTPAFKGITTLAESRILLPLPRDVHEFVADIRLFSVLQYLHFYYKSNYLSYHGIREVDLNDKHCVGWSPYVRSSGDVLDVPAPEVTS